MDDSGTTERDRIYDEKIGPLMKQIIATCKAHNIPIVASFDLSGPEDTGLRCTTTIVPPETHQDFHAAASMLREGFVAYTRRLP